MGRGGASVEWFYTDAQRLEANPYRTESRPYSVFGVLATRQIGPVMLFNNGENLTDVQQNALGSAGPADARGGRAVDGGCVGAARRPHHQRRREGDLLSDEGSAGVKPRPSVLMRSPRGGESAPLTDARNKAFESRPEDR